MYEPIIAQPVTETAYGGYYNKNPYDFNSSPDSYARSYQPSQMSGFGVNQDAKLLHYTLGTPSFHEFATTPMGDEWHRERIYTDYCLQRNL